MGRCPLINVELFRGLEHKDDPLRPRQQVLEVAAYGSLTRR